MMKMILYLLLLLLFGEIEGTLEDCTANKCLFCLELTPASCDVDLDVMENGAILQYTINCTAPPECVSMPVSNSYGPDSEYCAAIVNILLVGDVGTDTKWLYQASELHIPPPINEDNRTCEDIVLRHEFETNPLTPDCTALSKNCSTATSSLSGCLSQLVCFCYNDDCGASIHATVTIFNDTDTTTTSTTPPSTTATHTPTATSISPSSTYMYMYTASTSSSTLSDKGISSGAISYTSTTSILPSDTNNDSLNETVYMYVILALAIVVVLMLVAVGIIIYSSLCCKRFHCCKHVCKKKEKSVEIGGPLAIMIISPDEHLTDNSHMEFFAVMI